ncbi:hypothetical protein ONZ45_g16449 [Pleurotus djamor]|nr:hypothetical protein ONZ45_g16449 [Pleurotus djamor]
MTRSSNSRDLTVNWTFFDVPTPSVFRISIPQALMEDIEDADALKLLFAKEMIKKYNVIPILNSGFKLCLVSSLFLPSLTAVFTTPSGLESRSAADCLTPGWMDLVEKRLLWHPSDISKSPPLEDETLLHVVVQASQRTTSINWFFLSPEKPCCIYSERPFSDFVDLNMSQLRALFAVDIERECGLKPVINSKFQFYRIDTEIDMVDAEETKWEDVTMHQIKRTNQIPLLSGLLEQDCVHLVIAAELEDNQINPLQSQLKRFNYHSVLSQRLLLYPTYYDERCSLLLQEQTRSTSQPDILPGPDTGPVSGAVEPAIGHYSPSTSHSPSPIVPFNYICPLEKRHDCVTFLAETRSIPKEPIVVKFVSTYGLAAHQFLAKLGHAPRLRYFGPLPGGESPIVPLLDAPPGICLDPLRMVVMDFVESIERPPPNAYQSVKAVLEKLHQAGLVFGDLRPNNILFDKKNEVQFIDFNWAGYEIDVPAIPHGEIAAYYPYDINMAAGIPWHPDVRPLSAIRVIHDKHMLERLNFRI